MLADWGGKVFRGRGRIWLRKEGRGWIRLKGGGQGWSSPWREPMRRRKMRRRRRRRRRSKIFKEIRKGGRGFWGSWLRRLYGSEFPRARRT